MSSQRADTHQHAVAQRNIDAVLDAAERLLQSRRQPNISAVAAEAGLSRPTVYAHFSDRTRLVEAVVERAVTRAVAEIDAIEPDRGPAPGALERVIQTSWEQLAHSSAVADAAASELSADAMRRAHLKGRRRVRELTDRGRAEGAFRTDVPAGWLVTSFFALVHAARDEVAAGELTHEEALTALLSGIPALFGVVSHNHRSRRVHPA
jgi:AcrR family transcriptional regulator